MFWVPKDALVKKVRKEEDKQMEGSRLVTAKSQMPFLIRKNPDFSYFSLALQNKDS